MDSAIKFDLFNVFSSIQPITLILTERSDKFINFWLINYQFQSSSIYPQELACECSLHVSVAHCGILLYTNMLSRQGIEYSELKLISFLFVSIWRVRRRGPRAWRGFVISAQVKICWNKSSTTRNSLLTSFPHSFTPSTKQLQQQLQQQQLQQLQQQLLQTGKEQKRARVSKDKTGMIFSKKLDINVLLFFW